MCISAMPREDLPKIVGKAYSKTTHQKTINILFFIKKNQFCFKDNNLIIFGSYMWNKKNIHPI